MTENMRNALKGVGSTWSSLPSPSAFIFTDSSSFSQQAASKKPLAPWATSWETAWTCAAGSRRNPTKLARGSRRWAGVSFSVFFSVSTSAYFEITLSRNSMVLKRFELAFDMTFTDYYQQARERLSPALRSMPMIRLLTRRLERRIIWIWGLGSRL